MDDGKLQLVVGRWQHDLRVYCDEVWQAAIIAARPNIDLWLFINVTHGSDLISTSHATILWPTCLKRNITVWYQSSSSRPAPHCRVLPPGILMSWFQSNCRSTLKALSGQTSCHLSKWHSYKRGWPRTIVCRTLPQRVKMRAQVSNYVSEFMTNVASYIFENEALTMVKSRCDALSCIEIGAAYSREYTILNIILYKSKSNTVYKAWTNFITFKMFSNAWRMKQEIQLAIQHIEKWISARTYYVSAWYWPFTFWSQNNIYHKHYFC